MRWPRPEDRRADPDRRRAFSNRQGIVPTHAHGEQARAGRSLPEGGVAQFSREDKALADPILVVRMRGNGHETLNSQVLIARQGLQRGQDLLRWQARLTPLTRGIDLHVHRQVPLDGGQASLESVSEAEGIEGLEL